MENIKKELNLKIILLLAISIFLINGIAYGMDVPKRGAIRVPIGSSQRIKGTFEKLDTRQNFKSKAINKFKRKIGLLKSLDLPLAFLTLNMSGDIQGLMAAQRLNNEIIIQADLKIGLQDINQAVDQYNSPPQWRSYYISYGEKGSIDVSGYKSIRIRVAGQGNIIAQLMDISQSSDRGSWQHGLSKVYK